MKKTFIVLALVSSILATIFAVLPISNLAIIPALAALIFGLVAFYLSKKTGDVKKIIQFIFLLTIVALSLTIFKAVFTTTEVADTKTLDTKETQLKEEAIEELENIDIDVEEFEDIDIAQ
ncbi:FUSC family protein [Aestuariivivens marinum]|uniref:FUSC family protein n=1 Tax=Aestuariivivens marinum TaxID=2913555 RepID=UPI001F59F81C|nr:FUSC family protein [Aestuariivivens marinum]